MHFEIFFYLAFVVLSQENYQLIIDLKYLIQVVAVNITKQFHLIGAEWCWQHILSVNASLYNLLLADNEL